MTDELAAGMRDAEPSRPQDAAGAALRAAREDAGLSIDTVAQHLKLAPRQVKALEDGAWSELPGRTFVRGFARNYARLMQLDPDAVVAALPDAVQAPALDKPAIGSSARAMGELPASEARQRRWSHWAIPLALVALIGVAAFYEFTRPKDAPRPPDARGTVTKAAPLDPIGPLGNGATPLPNPLTASEVGTSSPQGAGATSAGVATSGAAVESLGMPRAASVPPSLPITMSAEPSAAAATGAATLVIAYRAPAWTEVRDASGQRILLVTGAADSTQTVSGTPPFELTLGNASATSVTWRGAAFDLEPHIRANIARVRLP